MYIIRLLAGLLLAAILSACGGGGGSPGTTSVGTGGGSGGGGGGSTPPTTTTTVPTLSVSLLNSSGATTSTVSGTSTTTAQGVLRDADGKPVAGTVMTFTADASLVKFSPAAGTVLTDANGVAKIQVSPASAASAGAGTLKASALVGGSTVDGAFDFQITATPSAGVPTLNLGMRDASTNPTNSVSASGVTTVRAVLLDAAGTPVSGKVVTFRGDTSLIKMNPASGQVLTDATGLATVQVTPASLSAAGASTLSASATVAAQQLNSTFDFQLSAANLALQSLNLGSSSMPAYGNRAVSVQVTVNGTPAATTPVQVTFSASCGTITPATVTTDSSGTASTTYKADNATCAGSNVTVSAAAVGATPLSGTVAVSASLATNVQFVGAAPQLIYLTGSVGATQSQVSFKVVDANGNPLQNQQLQLSMVNSAPGVSLNTVGNTAPVTLSSDAAGLVNVAVFSGTVPTSVQVRAVLAANASVSATSNVLTVASGRPVQRAMSVAVEKLSIEGLEHDGVTTRVTAFLADRQGNPVPDGTQVNFTTQYGLMVPASCFTAGGTSSCSVNYRSQGDRSAPFAGRVAILAYVPGEEDFIDLNRNNVYDLNEPFTDLGNAYRDEYTAPGGVQNGSPDPGEFVVPRPGNQACATPEINAVPGTCDGVWGTVDVRVQAELVIASSAATFNTVENTRTKLRVLISDRLANSMPTGSTIAAAKVTGVPGSTCAVSKVAPEAVPNTLVPIEATVLLDGCLGGEVIGLTVTTPGGAVTPTTSTWLLTLP